MVEACNSYLRAWKDSPIPVSLRSAFGFSKPVITRPLEANGMAVRAVEPEDPESESAEGF